MQQMQQMQQFGNDDTDTPRAGIKVTAAQVQAILDAHGIPSDSDCVVEPVECGFNNQTLIVNSKYVLRLCGRHWKETKTLNEMVALTILGESMPEFAPRLLGYQCKASGLLAYEYILMTKLEGSNLEELWPSLTLPQKLDAVRQIAKILHRVRTTGSWKETGSLSLAPDGRTVVVVDDLIGFGRASSWATAIENKIRTQVEKLENLAIDSILRPLQSLLPRIRQFQALFHEQGAAWIDAENNATVVFTQGDFELRNVIGRLESGRIVVSGLVDYEFAGPADWLREWHEGFSFAGCRLVDELDEPDEAEAEAISDLSALRSAFLEEASALGIKVPLMSDPAVVKACRVYHLCEYILPWWLADVKQVPGDDRNQERLRRAMERLDKYLGFFGL
ncbi:uncharacterized protein BJ171DRAFT_501768 [Polychytrium aggregatum]|uniref:uncharacterized protein n=1 Tax=Polychytrium aggregatum TaxID=110093 RepID=UPI0022FE388E|nr:uncharacterized protein BJ171DRAFT_501768 [Polychytrium aggregatum]KAI9205320.1 hypothetical protein BJ171DRAFT_501768 [Polychytrium aggregatum]